ncbi:fatty acid CoA ligase family protein [Atopomonas sediminilitoris]|uniref:fatty acid CoA ligase family protein n=1 Tax=Atopomonas sediminilitoris TaxID=2919919 RepID=UPI001F4D78E3|nr:fatty acid CoA ligase family protein [Atopomonas sediminilitoris]MCJ8169128.1 fatty acid CoA ligase family protein [Atopomonas sediminilitoris]
MSQSNFCQRVFVAAQRNPDRLALNITDPITGSSHSQTYAQLLSQAASWQQRLVAQGLVRGDRVLLLAKPSASLYALLLALLGLGLVPVLLDRGMSRARMIASIKTSAARAAIGERAILRHWYAVPALWRLPRFALDGRAFGVRDLRQGWMAASLSAFRADALSDEHAHGLISFTSGSTGAPKGADRTHHSLIAQHEAIRSHWPDQDDDIDAPCFPVLVLHNLACGISTVMPAIDLAAPGSADGERLLAQFSRAGVTRLAAAPAFMQQLLNSAKAAQQTLPKVRSVVVGGSTVTPALLRDCASVFPHAHCRVVYGSTEAEPIAEIDMPLLLSQWGAQAGHLVGKPVAQAEVCVVRSDMPLGNQTQVQEATLSAGQCGEILVAGEHVLKRYIDNPQACAENKIPRADGLVWHRTGDCGFFDQQGQLWLTGRLKDAVPSAQGPLFTYPLEMQVDALAGVTRCALVARPSAPPVLILQGQPSSWDALKAIVAHWALPNLHWAEVAQMPVDGRHNSKIDRPALLNSLPTLTLKVLQ